MAYSELVKNFEKIRDYMRDFYVYGFKSRKEFHQKSLRSYDDERRRVESWLGICMGFVNTDDGKNVFISVDTRNAQSNPLYMAWKAKSFTDGDIVLHFAIFDVLYSPEIRKTLSELIDEIDLRLHSQFAFDESTLRKKLKEYTAEGIIRSEKRGRSVLYSRSENVDISTLSDALDFFSEDTPCGVIGSFLLDKLPDHQSIFSFKHHYITQALDSDILAELFSAIRSQCIITVDNRERRCGNVKTLELVPLKIYISVQNGRQNLMAYHIKSQRLCTYRIDYISNVVTGEKCSNFSSLRALLNGAEHHMWGVSCGKNIRTTEHVEFDIAAGIDEQFIFNRLEREKRCGNVEKIDETHYRFTADVYDTTEMLPWIRTFISRITRMNFSNRTVENRLKSDIEQMYRMYGIEGGEKHDFQ